VSLPMEVRDDFLTCSLWLAGCLPEGDIFVVGCLQARCTTLWLTPGTSGAQSLRAIRFDIAGALYLTASRVPSRPSNGDATPGGVGVKQRRRRRRRGALRK